MSEMNRLKAIRRAGWLAVAAGAVIGLSCDQMTLTIPESVEPRTIQLTGAGGSFPAPLYQESVYRPTYSGTGVISLESSFGGFYGRQKPFLASTLPVKALSASLEERGGSFSTRPRIGAIACLPSAVAARISLHESNKFCSG
jgi:ABC-type phosphate transport system substrate-binding protein